MIGALPPDLLAPDDRRRRIAELESRMTREWVRYVFLEMLLIGIPTLVVVLLWRVAETLSDPVVVVVLLVVGCVVMAALFAYTFLVRIRPLQEEIQTLQALENAGGLPE